MQTARAVLREELAPAEGAQVLGMQRDQIGDLLRSDRHDVTQSEADTVSTTLRRLAEQVADAAGPDDTQHHLAMAEHLGALAQMLR